MEYKCRTVPVVNIITNRRGFIKSLCETCKVGDCSNPIERRKVSIFGITKNLKVYVKGERVNFVVECEGYIT